MLNVKRFIPFEDKTYKDTAETEPTPSELSFTYSTLKDDSIKFPSDERARDNHQ